MPAVVFAMPGALDRISQTALVPGSVGGNGYGYKGRTFADAIREKAQGGTPEAESANVDLSVTDKSLPSRLRRPSSLPLVQDRKQFQHLWTTARTDAKRMVLNSLGEKLDKQRDASAGASEDHWDQAIADLLSSRVDDEHVYSALRRDLGVKGGAGASESDHSRAHTRVHQIKKIIPKGFSVGSMLDIGCAEGSITAAIGSALHLSPEDVHGVDIRDVGNAEAEGFTFHVYDGATLPFESGSIDFVVALMTLHHIQEPSRVLSEAHRICSDNGYLIIREHDCATAHGDDATVALDVVHGLYALAMSDPPEWPGFATEYYAFYRDRAEWDAAIAGAGWDFVKSTQTRGNMRYFYSLYKKVPGSDGKRGERDRAHGGWGRSLRGNGDSAASWRSSAGSSSSAAASGPSSSNSSSNREASRWKGSSSSGATSWRSTKKGD